MNTEERTLLITVARTLRNYFQYRHRLAPGAIETFSLDVALAPFDREAKYETPRPSITDPIAGERWVDIPHDQIIAIENMVKENIAKELENEAAFNDKVARDEKDHLAVRLDAERAAHIRRSCAELIRSRKRKV